MSFDHSGSGESILKVNSLMTLTTTAMLLLALPSGITAQEFDLSIPNIMRGTELVGVSPQGLRGESAGRGGAYFSWSPDSRFVYFRWQQPGVDTSLTVYRVRPGESPERLPDADRDTIVAGFPVWDRDGRRALFNLEGDIVLWDRGEKRRLLRTNARESNLSWSADESEVFFRSGSDVFALSVDEPSLRQLTDIRSGNAPSEETEAEGQQKFLDQQQEELFEFIRENHDENYPWNRTSGPDTTAPRPFYAGAGKSAFGATPTPDGAWVALNVNEPARDTRRVDMPVWITDDGYTDIQSIRTKVGADQGHTRVAIINTATGDAVFVGDSIAEDDHDVRLVTVSPDSRHVLLRVETKDNTQRWYAVVDLPGMETRVVDHLVDEAWVGGPTYFTAGFLPDGETVYFVSEETGWAHLYLVSAEGGEATALTSGEWEVMAVRLSRDGDTWQITANREGFAEVHQYSMPVRGGEMRQLTTAVGRQDAVVSPDGRWLAIAHSEANMPWELYLQRNRTGQDMERVTHSTTDEWDSFAWIKPEIVMIPARDGVEVPARIYRPTVDAGPEGQRRAVVFVHGAGYLQNVHNWWSLYYREYMFHHLLAARGYTVLDIDYRGSNGHGRDWRTAIYRHMGGVDLTDQVDGARWLVQNAGIDSTRIGIYGGSYGGFITLMAMFTEPGVFAAGAALRPVTDWASYNHGYTSNILNEPQNDSLAYRQSSPIYFAEGLEGHLLMAHGMVDDNVHFSDTARLAQRLIELGKENWEVAMYPAERHGFTEPSSWVDEYRRILKLFEQNLM